MGTLGRLTANLLDLSLDTFDFTQTLTDTLGDLGTDADGFDRFLEDTIKIIEAGGVLSGSLGDDLGLAASIAGSIDPNSLASDVAALPGDLATGAAIVADATALAGSVGPAPTPGGGGGGGGSATTYTGKLSISFTGTGSPQILCVTARAA